MFKLAFLFYRGHVSDLWYCANLVMPSIGMCVVPMPYTNSNCFLYCTVDRN